MGDKPLIVSERITAEQPIPGCNDMYFGAWRALKSVREAVESSKAVETAEDAMVIVSSLEATYEALYRA